MNNTFHKLFASLVAVVLSFASLRAAVPTVTVYTDMVTLPAGSTYDFEVDFGDYDGNPEVSIADENVARVSLSSQLGSRRTYTVMGMLEGTTYVTIYLPATDAYESRTYDLPVTVLSSVYTYHLVVNNAPQYGVSIEIWGTTYTASATILSSHSSISVADVNVRPLASYTSTVSITGNFVTVTYALKMPENGTFIRLKNYSSNQYLTLAADGDPLAIAPVGTGSIIYYDEAGHFLFYRNGQYATATNRMASVANASAAVTYTFTQGTGEFEDCFCIRSSEGKYLLGSSDGTTTSATADNGYAFWYVETLNTLPVETTASGYGFATLYCPVTLAIPGGVSAYYISQRVQVEGASGTEYKLMLEQLVSVIPANMPVILVGTLGTTYNFTLQYENDESAPASDGGLKGHAAAQVTAAAQGSGRLFALQPSKQNESVGFFPYTQATTKGFKCYFVASSGSQATSYRLAFSDDVTSVEAPMATVLADDTAVYNLCGQRVADSLAGLRPGIYIRGGRKVIIKK